MARYSSRVCLVFFLPPLLKCFVNMAGTDANYLIAYTSHLLVQLWSKECTETQCGCAHSRSSSSIYNAISYSTNTPNRELIKDLGLVDIT